MPISSLEDAVEYQVIINRFLAENDIKDLVGDYGEILVHKALGGIRQNTVNRGFDIQHNQYNRIEVKTLNIPSYERGVARVLGYDLPP